MHCSIQASSEFTVICAQTQQKQNKMEMKADSDITIEFHDDSIVGKDINCGIRQKSTHHWYGSNFALNCLTV